MKNSKSVLVLSLVTVAAVTADAVQPASRNAILANSPANSRQDDKSAEQVNKNIQVLKGLPNSQLLTVMHFMRTSLGGRCDYCHIAENGKYWMDDKPPRSQRSEVRGQKSEVRGQKSEV